MGKRGFAPQVMRITFADPATDEEFPVEIPFVVFWSVYQTIKALGRDYAYTVALYGASLVKPDLSDEDKRQIADKVAAVDAFLKHRPDHEADALKWSYNLLQNVKITRREAARFASEVLGYTVPEDSWRKRVDEWARKQGLPKVDLYKRRRETTERRH